MESSLKPDLEPETQQLRQQIAELTQANITLQAELANRQQVEAALQAEVAHCQQDMTQLRRAEQVSRGQTEALIKTLAVLAAEPVLDNFLGYVLQAIAEQFGECSGSIWLYNPTHDNTVPHINYEDGQIQTATQYIDSFTSSQPLLRQWDDEYLLLLRQKKILIHDERHFAQSPAYAPYQTSLAKRGIKMIMMVSLFFGETFLGYLSLRNKQRRDYKLEELELVRVLAYQASLAIQITWLAEHAQQMAVLEERNRLAREIHDTLAQGLTGIIIQLQAAEEIDTTAIERETHIAQACLLAKSSLAEARRSVQALRPQVLEDMDLYNALTHLLNQMTQGTGVQTACQLSGSPFPLLPEVESSLLRIGQEAVTNTLKYARASEIQLALVYDSAQVQLRVQDNGCGFNSELPLKAGYGLLNMRERADSIGADLLITSQPGQGTIIEIAVSVTPQLAHRR